MATSLIIESVRSNGNKRQRAVSNIDSVASASQLEEFSRKLTALSTDSYVDAVRVEKVSLEEWSGGSSEVTLSVDYANYSGSADLTVTNITNGVRIGVGEWNEAEQDYADGYIDVTYQRS